MLKPYYDSGTTSEVDEELNGKREWSVKSIRMKDTWGNRGAQRKAGDISEEMTFKKNGDEENVPGRGTVCTKAWRKALICGEVQLAGAPSVREGEGWRQVN